MAYWTGQALPKAPKPKHAIKSEDLIEVVEYGFQTMRWEIRCTCRTKHTFVARLLSEATAKWSAHAGVDNVLSGDVKIGAEAMSA